MGGSRGNKNNGEKNMSVKEDESTVDWRGRTSDPNKHGGMRAAAFLLGLFSFINFNFLFQAFSFSFSLFYLS